MKIPKYRDAGRRSRKRRPEILGAEELMERLQVEDRQALANALRARGIRFHEDRTGAIFCNAAELDPGGQR